MSRKLVLLLLLLPLVVKAQKISVEDYIDTYKDIAMKEMKEYKIPASITLAQGILESGAGNSALARKANNHFGINAIRTGMGELIKWMMMRRTNALGNIGKQRIPTRIMRCFSPHAAVIPTFLSLTSWIMRDGPKG